ncbi:MAG: ABC transporter permease, partial [Pseudomonadales bacterium]|nr:ABC transporter permease [Pseudomonadales bacterium]
MLATAFKISLRTLWREKRYAAINIAGLSLALACVIVLGLYLRHELSYDRHFEGYENIYRLENSLGRGEIVSTTALTSSVAGVLLAQDNPEIEEVVRVQKFGQVIVRHENGQNFAWDQIVVTPNMFRVFKHHILYGDPAAFEELRGVAVSESFARFYFGDANPLGETLSTDIGIPYPIALVFADLPDNTHFKYKLLYPNNLNISSDVARQRETLFVPSAYTYVKMRPGYDPGDWAEVSQAFYDKHMKERFGPRGLRWRSWLQPLADVHLYS